MLMLGSENSRTILRRTNNYSSKHLKNDIGKKKGRFMTKALLEDY